ncbi:MAG: YihA family ribosome biogenesis GTP-binding protein [Calditrichaeota bacterium]|nr:YihA family ribosome biogenesis GTP-binding protein [Calditrichota bacterium]
MLQIKEVTFVKSITSVKHRPKPLLPEFSFAGRSNVGKSSLINCLLNRNRLAKVSKSPGKTQTLNYFLVNQQFFLVDLPGYGFARVPPAEQNRWKRMIENYLINNKSLCMLYVLVDALVGPKKNDFQLFEWLQFEEIPYQLILTKTDRIGRQKQQQRAVELRQLLNLNNVDSRVILFSSKTKAGRQELLNHMAECLTICKTYKDAFF